jgi:hypothetical protein
MSEHRSAANDNDAVVIIRAAVNTPMQRMLYRPEPKDSDKFAWHDEALTDTTQT